MKFYMFMHFNELGISETINLISYFSVFSLTIGLTVMLSGSIFAMDKTRRAVLIGFLLMAAGITAASFLLHLKGADSAALPFSENDVRQAFKDILDCISWR